VTVTGIPVSGVSLNKSSISLAVGQSFIFQLTFSPSNATNKQTDWTLSNNSGFVVLGVSTNENYETLTGYVTGRSVGTVTLTVTTADGNKTATCVITVY
jgi:uncharacterized protein YjdB